LKRTRGFWVILVVCLLFFFTSLSIFFWEKSPCRQTDVFPIVSDAFDHSLDYKKFIVEEELKNVFSKCFGYTLIREKPASVEYCGRLEFSSNPEYKKCFFDCLERMFSRSDRFILKVFHYADFYSEIILIDIPSVTRLIKQDKYLRNFVKKEYGSTKKLHQSLMDPKLHIFDCLRRDNVAIGIVLGYGEENSRYFQRYLDIGFYLKKYPLVCLLPFDSQPMPETITLEPVRRLTTDAPYKPFIPKKHSNEFASFEDEWHWMRRVRNKDYDETEIPYLFQLPFFISKKGAETEKVCKKYNKARDKLAKLFCGRKFSEVIAEEAAKR
jgi:hypothetical protein